MILLGVIYLALCWYGARYPELELDDPDSPVVELPEVGPTVKVGLHFLLPVVVLVWALMVERLSPGLSAFYATMLMIVILITQRPIMAFFRGTGALGQAFQVGLVDLRDGLAAGARNMIGIGVATAAAGIIVGTVTLTGVGLKMTEFVEFISAGQLMLMLIFTAVISLILGMGLPTTANYIVVSTLMAPVVVELGAQNGLIVPLIAVHLFVFYFGIMADVTPPVGLGVLRGRRDLGRRSDQDRLHRVLVQHAHGRPAVPVHLQHPAAADRHRQRLSSDPDRRDRGDRDAGVRGRHAWAISSPGVASGNRWR